MIKEFIKQTGLDDVGFKQTSELARRVFKKEEFSVFIPRFDKKVTINGLAKGLEKFDDNFHTYREATIHFLKTLEVNLDVRKEQTESLIIDILRGIQKVTNRAEIREEELNNRIDFLEKFLLKQEQKEKELIKKLPNFEENEVQTKEIKNKEEENKEEEKPEPEV